MRSERAKVAERVRALLAAHEPPARAAQGPWLPDEEFDDLLFVQPAAVPLPERIRDAAEQAAKGVVAPPPRALSWRERVRLRVDPGRRGAAAVGVAALVAAAGAGWWVAADRPAALEVTAASPSSRPSASVSAARPSSELVVDVIGRVRKPGVLRLPKGARVVDAIKAAGGAEPGVDLSNLNMARPLSDGEQIAVGVPGATAAAAPAGPGGSGGLVNLNTATPAQLEALPGVGPVLAQNMLSWRAEHGRFESVSQLREVTGIGPSKYAQLEPLVTV